MSIEEKQERLAEIRAEERELVKELSDLWKERLEDTSGATAASEE